jgi:hypothetical protein
MISVGVFIFRAIRNQAASLRNGLSNNQMSNAIFSFYTEQAPQKLSDPAFVDKLIAYYQDQHGVVEFWPQLCSTCQQTYNADLNQYLRAAKEEPTRRDLFAMYTPLEKKLLFPILAVVWVCVKLFRKLSTKEKDKVALTKVVPEKNKEVKEENEQNDEQNKTEEADEIQQTKELAEIRDWD